MKVEKKNISPANRFKAVREQLGFTQQKLADALLLTRNYIAKIEAGIQAPSPRTVMALETLRVSLINNPNQPTDGGAALGGGASAPVPAKPDTRTPSELVRALRVEFDALLASTDHLPQRLHWLSEQMKEHLAVPKSWAGRPRGVHVTLPSQTAALSAETGKPLPAASRPARSA
ncbi:MAG: helix-turn-helix transcriptional regulator [Verrucomicrobia bacterium]|nr:helix-turn-helix transcriptional regulator [Verrucomicrobiota bacterium]